MTDTASGLNATAVVLKQPERITLMNLALQEPRDEDVVVDMEWSAISAGTERLLWSGSMPAFPGFGYPLVPGYESVGRIARLGAASRKLKVGERVFVPGARCYGEVRGLFGGAASRVVVPASRVTPLPVGVAEEGVLLALAATAYHSITAARSRPPDLIVGHGVLGRLMARLTLILSQTAPVVWEKNPSRRAGHGGYYEVIDPAKDSRRDYQAIYDGSGDAALLDTLISHLAPGGEVVLAGFYSSSLSFAYPPAFMREIRIRIAAEWRESDLAAVNLLVQTGQLSLDGLITHRHAASDAPLAYETAFTDASCLKMVLDWRASHEQLPGERGGVAR